MKRRALLGATLAGTALSGTAFAAGCGSNRRAPLPSVTIAGGTTGGVYSELAKAFAKEITNRWNIPANVLTTNESIGNLRLVAEGKADIGFATVDLCDIALQGDLPFAGVLPVAALAGLYEDYLQIIVSDASQITQVSDLSKYRVSVGARESGTEFIARRILPAAGLTSDRHNLPDLKELEPDAAAIQMLGGNLDAFFVLGGLPTPLVSDLAKRTKVRLLSIHNEAQFVRDNYSQIYLLRSIPSGTYGIDREISTIGVGNVILIRKDASDETAYRLTELLMASKQSLVKAHPEALRLDPSSAVSTFKIPLHQGALRYYRTTKPFLG